MTIVEQPTGPLWTISQILAALFLIGTLLTFGALPLTLLAIYLIFLLLHFAYRTLRFSVKKSRDGVHHMAALRRSERLKLSVKQAQALVQIAPQIKVAQDFGEIAGLLTHIPGLKTKRITELRELNIQEKTMLDHLHQVIRCARQDSKFEKTLSDAQVATENFLNILSAPPALPAPELANGWLSFHEEIRMSVQEIKTSLTALAEKATALTTIQSELEAQMSEISATSTEVTLQQEDERPLDTIMDDLNAKLRDLPGDTKTKTFQGLFELSQSIDAAFINANRQPPHKLGLVADDVRRVHQVETLLSVYREKMEKLDQEKQSGKVDDGTYATMKSAWERMLEGELSALEASEA